MYRNYIFLWGIIFLACAVNWSFCVTLELFSQPNYSGLFVKKIVSVEDENKCTKLDKFYMARSLKTDKCVMLYENPDCTRKSGNSTSLYKFSSRIEKNRDHFGEEESWYHDRQDARGVHSFHVCRGAGAGLDVDLFSEWYYTGDILYKWRGVCSSCVNVDAFDARDGQILSIDNHGNSMYAFLEENCRGEVQFVPAGDNTISRALFSEYYGPEGDIPIIRSFRPGGDVNCAKLNATSSLEGNYAIGAPISSSGQFRQSTLSESSTLFIFWW